MSECHKIAIDYETNLSRTCGNVWEMSSDAAKKTTESNRICFIKVTECLQYLAGQGQAMQGDTDDESNFIQLLKPAKGERPASSFKMVREERRQIYLTDDMANHVIRDLVLEIMGGLFSTICDEYTDISNREQLTICNRGVDKELEAQRRFPRVLQCT